MRVSVTAIIHTLNERAYIEACIKSVEWADEIYVVDSINARVQMFQFLGSN